VHTIRIIQAGQGRAEFVTYMASSSSSSTVSTVLTASLSPSSSSSSSSSLPSLILSPSPPTALDMLTLIIYDMPSRHKARQLANTYVPKLPCYPFTAIPDYLMQAQYNERPTIDIEEYLALETE
jgi:hypothetical protein